MPDTELESQTWIKLTLIAERARREPQCQFISLAHLLDEGFLAEQAEAQLASLDALLAARLDEPASLRFTPVPLLGVPDWWADTWRKNCLL